MTGHAVLDEVPAGTLDDPSGDRPPSFEGGGVVEVRLLANQVRGALVDARPAGAVEAITGARWGLDGAEAVLKMRALVSNGDFEEYWRYHLKQEHQRVHRSRYASSYPRQHVLAA